MNRILIIEDNEDVRENVCEILELAGYEVYRASNGSEGVQSANKIIPDLILCDIMMPVLDGYGVVKILSNSPKLSRIPIIFLTAKTEKSDLRRGMGLGVVDYLTKPFEDIELLETVELRLKKSKALQAGFQQTNTFNDIDIPKVKFIEELDKITDACETRSYPKSSTIYNTDQRPLNAYYILQGQVALGIHNSVGKTLILDVKNAGQILGHSDFFETSYYKTHAYCLEEVVVKLIPKPFFINKILNNRNLNYYLFRQMNTYRSHLEYKSALMAYGSVREKVAHAILDQIDAEGVTTITIARREDLANLAGIAKETLIRTLADFKSEGLIYIQNQKIAIRNAQKLKDI